MSCRRGSVLIISLWVMAILVVFALSVAHRVSINLRLAKYQVNRLKAAQLARAGVNKAITQVALSNPDSPAMLSDPWSTGVDPNLFGKINVFENVTLRDTARDAGLPKETFSVRYARVQDYGTALEYRCIDDEESKINLNALNTPLRKAAFEMFLVNKAGMVRDDAAEFRRLLAQWIGDPAAEPLTVTFDTSFYKRQPLSLPEELLLVLECFFQAKATTDKPQAKAQEVYTKIREYITVKGDGTININTVSRLVLAEYCSAAVEVIQAVAPIEGLDDAVAQEVCNDIIELRSPDMFVQSDLQDIDALIASINNTTRTTPLGSPDGPGADPRSAILTKFFPYNDTSGGANNTTAVIPGILSVKSSNFRISSTGQADTVARSITAVYDRSKIVYWHEQ